MTVENYLAEAAALAGLAGIMGGFSLAAVVQLLTTSIGGRLATAGIVVFAAASVMFLYSLIVAVLSLFAAAELGRIPAELENLNVGALLIMFAAIYVLLAALAGGLDALQNGGYPDDDLCPNFCMFNHLCHCRGDLAFHVRGIKCPA